MDQEPQRPTNQAPMGQAKPNQPAVTKWLWITLIIVAILSGFFVAWYLLLGPGKTTEVITPVVAPTTTTKTTTTTTPTDLIYTNTTYGFTLTFPATWKGYKMKEISFPGETATYYINMPTTDKSAEVANTTYDAGYFAPFAISVYTLDQWVTVEAAEGSKDTLIIKNDTYAFAWSQSNGTAPNDWVQGSDIKGIIASFKLK